MKNKIKKGLEAAFALLLLKFVLTCYFASSVFLTKCDPRPFCSAGEEGTIVGLSLSHRPISSHFFCLSLPTPALHGSWGAHQRAAGLQGCSPVRNSGFGRAPSTSETIPCRGGTGAWLSVQNCTGKGAARSL